MALFNLKKKKDKSICKSDENNNNGIIEDKIQETENVNIETETSHTISIKVLGSNCDKCEDVYSNLNEAIKELNIQANIEHVEDLLEIVKYGVMSTPALVVNDKIEAVGRVLNKNQIIEILNKYL